MFTLSKYQQLGIVNMLSLMKSKNKEEFVNSLGRQLAILRKKAGFTQEKLAEVAELDRMTIALIETGRKRPSVVTVYRLAVALKVEPEEFFQDL